MEQSDLQSLERRRPSLQEVTTADSAVNQKHGSSPGARASLPASERAGTPALPVAAAGEPNGGRGASHAPASVELTWLN